LHPQHNLQEKVCYNTERSVRKAYTDAGRGEEWANMNFETRKKEIIANKADLRQGKAKDIEICEQAGVGEVMALSTLDKLM
jgi:hypothetical protein